MLYGELTSFIAPRKKESIYIYIIDLQSKINNQYKLAQDITLSQDRHKFYVRVVSTVRFQGYSFHISLHIINDRVIVGVRVIC